MLPAAERHCVAVAPVGDAGERVVDVVADAGVPGDVHLVAVPVRVRAGGVPDLGAAGGVDRAAARRVQRLHAADGAGVDLLDRSAGEHVAVGAAAAGAAGDADRAQRAGRLGWDIL